MREFLDEHGPVHRADPVVVFVAQRRIVVVVLVLDLHERDCLLQLLKGVLQHGRILEALDELGEELDVLGNGGHAVGVNGFDFWEQWEGLFF